MYGLATTRFNNKTWEENRDWREKNNHKGAIYGCPSQIKAGELLFILEMNNEKNHVEGVGLIRRQLVCDKYYKIYSDGNYNRYIYKSQYRIDRSELNKQEEKVVAMFDILLFKGSRHLKRGQGVTSVPIWVLNNRSIDFIKFFRKLFKRYFPKS